MWGAHPIIPAPVQVGGEILHSQHLSQWGGSPRGCQHKPGWLLTPSPASRASNQLLAFFSLIYYMFLLISMHLFLNFNASSKEWRCPTQLTPGHPWGHHSTACATLLCAIYNHFVQITDLVPFTACAVHSSLNTPLLGKAICSSRSTTHLLLPGCSP